MSKKHRRKDLSCMDTLKWLFLIATFPFSLIFWIVFKLVDSYQNSNISNSITSLDEIYELTPTEFEQYVGKLFKAEGYKVTDTPASNDGGVDLFVETDKTFGIVQCKRYGGSVGVKIIRELYGTMLHEKANIAYLVTTGTFTSQAIDFAEGKPIELIDGEELEIWAGEIEKSKTSSPPSMIIAIAGIDSSNIIPLILCATLAITIGLLAIAFAR